MRKIIFLMDFFFLCFTNQAQQYPLINYTPNDGLVSSRVRTIKQDSKGRLYFITYSGLSIYDGARFLNYRISDGLANDLVNDIYEASADSILVATNTQTLNVLVNRKIGIFKTEDNFYPVINRFLKSADNKLYIAADEGLFQLSGRKFIKLPFSGDKGPEPDQFFDQVIEWKNYLLLIPWKPLHQKCLFLYNKNSQKVSDILTGDYTPFIAKDYSGNVLVSTPEGLKQLDYQQLGEGKIVLTFLKGKWREADKIKKSNPFFDQENNLWLFNSTGVIKINSRGERQTIATAKDLKGGNLTDIFEDSEGMIWMASDGKGAIKIKGRNIQLIDELDETHLKIASINKQKDTLWFVNTFNNSISMITARSVKTLKTGIKMNSAGNIYPVGKKLYINDQWKIFVIDDKNNPSKYLHPKTIIEKTPSVSYGFGIADPYYSIIQFENRNDSAFYLTVIKKDSVIFRYRIPGMTDQFTIDSQKRLWCVTRDNHLLAFSLHPENSKDYLQLIKDYSKNLPFLFPRTIEIDSNNYLWIGTRYNGIFKIIPEGDSLKTVSHFTEKSGLSDNFIFRISIDRNNNVWAGTQSGLDKLFFKDNRYVISNISKSNNFFQSVTKIVCTDNLTTWALTNEGYLLKITPEVTKSLKVPPVLITLSKVNGIDTVLRIPSFLL